MDRRWLCGLVLGVTALLAPPFATAKEAPLARLGAAQRRAAATTVMTEHPSSLRHLKIQHGRQIKPALRKFQAGQLTPAQMLDVLRRPFIAGKRQVREFDALAVKAKPAVATAKMIDFEGKPMAPDTIPAYLEGYVRAVEKAGLRPGIEGDRLLLVRLPGASERDERDVLMRGALFHSIVDINLKRVLRGQGLPFERLIIPQAVDVAQMIEVHDAYDRVAIAAVDRLIEARRVPPGRREELLGQLKRIQVVPLVETAKNVLGADQMVRDYLETYRERLGGVPEHFILFVAGSDLNREVGPVAGQVCREILRSRMAVLEREHPEIDFIQWAGIGSGPMRSGAGKYPELTARIHPGMTFTVQPDQIDQPNLGQTLRSMADAAFRAKPQRLSPDAERRLLAVGSAFAEVHARLSLESALATIRLNSLLSVIQQRGRKATSSQLVYEKDGQLFVRSAKPKDEADTSAYGRSLDIVGYADNLGAAYPRQKRNLERWQAAIDRAWPKGLADPRAIGGAFARYVEGHALTTVAGLGHAIARAESRMGRREVAHLRSFIEFLVQNDGFVLTQDRDLVRRRFQVLQPGLTPGQIDARVNWYFADIVALERFLGRKLDTLVDHADRARYEDASRRLYRMDPFVRYLQGQDISLSDWSKIMDAIIPLLSNPSWNRLGLLTPSMRVTRSA